ncbi:MAG: zf-HC2 domain-containing protein [Paenibacillus sp.]|uniref:Transmembrane transcriptional regulator (Anti-sigma factor RsiW) n=1 Tax=Paenibacillus aquistagni TaxID=1852522 RepID=A0A1X7LV76_9BACL|nr:zf-HC2 domain-containing protein [Paenibacillus aquistagni]MBR2570280.1 zf-HC2 domain-containing protein [Paenibacillus sp.]NMM55541.1 anti-sigma factor [Paenibacillus aquistagni]SMG57771.1 Transmembrane transcriptional regulator (anti-sigma factor RsiW) [Paenibacillus aquistagni]
MDCKQAVSLMHSLLDDDLEQSSALELKEHMLGCPACKEHFHQLESTEQLLYGFNHRLQTPSPDLTERILKAIPEKQKQQAAWLKWVKRHPAITVAAVFVLVMMGSALSMWNADQQMIVKGQQLDGVIIEENKVIIPNGKVVKGDLTIHNGLAEVYGDVEGNVTVVDGRIFQASTAHISGSVQQIDEAMSWIWYQITNLFSSAPSAK